MTFDHLVDINEDIKKNLFSAGLAALLPLQAHTASPPNTPKPGVEQVITYSPDDYVIATILGEARNQGIKGMQAIMNVIANRAKHVGRNDVQTYKEVVLQPWQFSIWNNKKTDHDQRKFIMAMYRTGLWNQAAKLLEQQKQGKLPDITRGATFYHTKKVSPSWKNIFTQTAVIGDHIFYTHGKNNVSSFAPKRRKISEEIDTPNAGFLSRPIGGPNLINFGSSNPSVGIYRGSDQIHAPTTQLTLIKYLKNKRRKQRLKRHARRRKQY